MMTTPTTPVLKATGLHRHFEGVHAVAGVDLEVAPGQTVAIIGPNKIVERPVFHGDEIVRAKLMNLSISCDHRVVDGWDAASFVQAVKKLLETPVLLFAD